MRRLCRGLARSISARSAPVSAALVAVALTVAACDSEVEPPNEYKLGEATLKVAANYVLSHGHNHAESSVHIRLHPLYMPDLSADRPSGNIYGRARPSQAVWIALQYEESGRIWQDTVLGVRGLIRSGEIEAVSNEEADFPGLRQYRWGVRRRYVVSGTAAARPSGQTPSGNPLAYECDEERNAYDPVNEAMTVCFTQYAYSDSIGLYYAFYARNLAHWRRIDGQVRSFVHEALSAEADDGEND